MLYVNGFCQHLISFYNVLFNAAYHILHVLYDTSCYLDFEGMTWVLDQSTSQQQKKS
jgi:hypothetical protein